MLLLVIAGIALPQVEGAEARIGNDAPFAIPTFHCLGIYNGRMPQGQETHGLRGVPVYAANTGFDSVTKTGRFQLAPDSPGAGAAQIVPNFSDGYVGPAPDIGAHQRGARPMRYGVTAGQP